MLRSSGLQAPPLMEGVDNTVIKFPQKPALRGGWFPVARSDFDDPIIGAGKPMKPANPKKRVFSRFEAWLWLKKEAAYKPKQVNNKGALMTLDRGQLMAAHSYLAAEWNWSSDKPVRNFLRDLVRAGHIHISVTKKKGRQTGNQIQVITIANYEDFSTQCSDLGHAEGQAVDAQRASQGRESNKGTSQQKKFFLDPPQAGEVGSSSKVEVAAAPARSSNGRVRAEEDTHSGKRLSADWTLPDEWRQWALETIEITAAEVDRQAERFRDYWVSASGQSARKRDWFATWRNWLRRDFKDRPRMHAAAQQKASQSPPPNWWKGHEEAARGASPEGWEEFIQQRANGKWPVEYLGPPPGTPECLVPASVVKKLNLVERYGS